MVLEAQNKKKSLYLTDLERDACVSIEHRDVRSVSMHSHEFLELSYILNGYVEHTLDGVTETLHARDYLIVDYGSCHSYAGCDGGRFDNIDCLFLPALLDPALKGTKSLRAVLEHYLLHFNMKTFAKNPARMVFHDEDGQVLRLLERIGTELERRDAGFAELIRCYLVEILLLTMRKIDGVQSAAAGNEISAYLVAYVEAHYAEPLTLGKIAAQMNYSLPYVSQRFREDMGVGFARYVQNYRVMHACRLLAETQMSFAEITDTVGYFDSKCFAQLVKRNTGLSPSEFRRRHRGGV
ncbi:MAG: helix-turn-helix domain-containing protein [Clostridia bacterium]|nr:helix-turn-helix domain-containing protein [Clostridia bacterium]